MTTTDWLTLATLIATVPTLCLVVVGELRHRRQYHRVDFCIDHVGEIKDSTGREFALFELTNCGTATATRISMTPIGGKEASSDQVRPIRVLGPGETKRFLVELIDELDECWAFLAYQSSEERRFVCYTWEPLNASSPLGDVQAADMRDRTTSLWARCTLQWRRLAKTVEPVGPNAAPGTRVRAYREEKTSADMQIAGEKLADWFDRWKAHEAKEKLDEGAADTM
ncbi:hypothetical protein GS462_21730 [Rhodococcus hoagii]|nr:hypothetical protein [Prescottella equi]MBM4653018.1 hypothetical protein [Prescottella equi]MBM4687712.1 hypothetical protein [Prescottella equi]